MTGVVLVRHAESTWNAQNRFQGQGGSGLSARGRRQAEAVAASVAARWPEADRLVCSDLARCRETAAAILARLPCPEHVDPAWREIDVGRWTGVSRESLVVDEPTAHAAWSRMEDVDLGGETWTALRARVGPALQALAGRDGTAVVVTHGGTLRMAAAVALGLSRGHEHAVGRAENAGLSVLRRVGDGWRLEAHNETGHLAPTGR